MPDETTADKVLRHLHSFDLKRDGEGQYRANRPWSSNSDSHGLTLKIEDGEHGAFHDKVDGGAGSLYDLADKLGIDRPQGDSPPSSKRAYTNLADYAQAHGVDANVYVKAGWEYTTHMSRPCLRYTLKDATGRVWNRYRFIDGEKPTFINDPGYKAIWYGLDRALTTKPNVLVICNGAPSVVAAQHWGVPAVAQEGGERALSDANLAELNRKWQGDILIALEGDKAGKETTAKLVKQLPNAKAIDLQLSGSQDLADFCKLYTAGSLAELQTRASQPPAAEDTVSVTFNELCIQGSQTFEGIRSGKIVQMGLLSHIPAIDQSVGSFMPARVHIILGATGMGKSTLSLSFASWFMSQAPGLIISTETPPELWLAKAVAYRAYVPVHHILEGSADKIQADKIKKAYQELRGSKSRIFKAIAPDIGDVEQWVRRWQKPLGAKWLLVDSISRVTARGKHNIYDRITEISNRLQALTQETGMTVVATSQVGRKLRDRANKLPTPEDGYGSGALEQDADVVMQLYYHHYYVRQGILDATDKYPPHKAIVRIGKHRWREPSFEAIPLRFVGGVGFYPWKEDAIGQPSAQRLAANDIDMWS